MEPATTLTFSSNGKVYEWNGSLSVNAAKGSLITLITEGGIPSYSFTARDLDNYIHLQMQTSRLSIRTYSKTTTNISNNFREELELQSNHYYMNKVGDFATIVVTKIETLIATGDRFASGTITTKMSKEGTSEKIEITNGTFKAVKIIE